MLSRGRGLNHPRQIVNHPRNHAGLRFARRWGDIFEVVHRFNNRMKSADQPPKMEISRLAQDLRAINP